MDIIKYDELEVKVQNDSILSDGFGLPTVKYVMRNKELSVYAKSIYCYLSSYANGNNNRCFPSISLMCSELSINKNTLAKYMNELLDSGLIRKYRTQKDNLFSKNVYEIILSKSEIEELKSKRLQNKEIKKCNLDLSKEQKPNDIEKVEYLTTNGFNVNDMNSNEIEKAYNLLKVLHSK